MGHFAKVVSGVVVDMMVAEPEFFDTFVDSTAGRWIQTSYNTRGGVHYDPETGEPSDDQTKALRYNYAGIGYLYDAEYDAFYPPKPDGLDYFTLDKNTFTWVPPFAEPQGIELAEGEIFVWNDEKYAVDQSTGWEILNILTNEIREL
jgi:hypothetical protein